MSEKYPTSSVSVEFVDTTIMNIPSLFPDLSEDIILTIARAIPFLGISALQFDNDNLGHNKDLITAISAAYEFDYDQVLNNPGNEVSECPRLSVVSSLDPEDINKGIETLKHYGRPLIEIAIPCSARSMKEMLATKHLKNYSNIIQDSLNKANELTMESDDFLLGCSLVDPMTRTNKPEFVDTVIDMALEMFSLDLINFNDLMGDLDPFDTYEFFMNVFKRVYESSNTGIVVSAEFNNDGGLALANSLYFIKSAIDFARNNKTHIHTRVKTNISNLGGRLSGCDIFSLDLALRNHSLADLSSSQQLTIPDVSTKGASRAIEIFRILNIDVPIMAPVIGYNILSRELNKRVIN